MGFRAEVWTRPGHASFGHVDTIEAPMKLGATRRGGGLGEGDMWLPADWEAARLNTILFADKDAPANAVTALIRYYRDGDESGVDAPFFEWLADGRVPPPTVGQAHLTASGLDVNSLFGWATLEAWDWDGTADFRSRFPDWIWGGRNLLGSLSGRYVAERTKFVMSNVDDGTWTITVTNDDGTDTTAALDWDIPLTGPSGLVLALSALSNVTFVEVDGTPGEEYQVTFADEHTDIIVTADASGLIGNWQLGTFATGGTFTVTVDGNTSAAIAYNASAADLKTALEAITGITTVTVDKTESADPDHTWVIYFDTPESVTTFTVDDTLLTGTSANGAILQLNAQALQTASQQAVIVPVGWEASRSYIAQIPHGELEEFRMWQTGDPTLPAGCDTAIMFNGTEPAFPGIQKQVKVQPGGIYQASAKITSNTAGNTVRLVIRDLAENELNGAGNARDEQAIAVAGTFQDFSIPDLIIPEGVEEVLVRVGHVDLPGTDPDRIFVACPEFNEGLAVTTIGGIIEAVYTDADLREVWGATPFLELDFDATNDSAGVAWAEAEVKARFNMNMGYSLILAEASHRGYEWRTIPKQQKTSLAADDGTWLLQLFNPGTAGTDLTGLVDPAILSGSDVVARAGRMFAPSGTAVRVQGADGFSSRAVSAAAVTALGRREVGVQAPDLFSLTDTAAVASADLDTRLARSESITPTVRPDPTVDPTPGVDFDVFDTLNVADQPYVTRAERRLAAWTGVFTPDIPDGEFLLSFTSETFVGQSAVNAGVRQLLREFEAIRRDGIGDGLSGEAGPAAETTGSSLGAFVHLGRAAAQTIPVDGTPIVWDSLGSYGLFPVSVPTSEVPIPMTAYYDIGIDLGWASWTGGGSVWITNTNSEGEVVIAPATWMPAGIWTSTDGQVGSWVAKGLQLSVGDIIRVYVDADDVASQTLELAALTVEVVDRTEHTTTYETDLVVTIESGGVSSFDMDLPTYIAGDLVILGVNIGNNPSETLATPAGWTAGPGASGEWGRMFWKVMDGTEGATVTLVRSAATNSDGMMGWAYRIRGLDYSTLAPDFSSMTATQNAPQVNMSHGLRTYQVLVAAFAYYSFNPVTEAGYTELVNVDAGFSTPKIGLWAMPVAAELEDPALTITNNGFGTEHMVTIAVARAV